MFILNLKRLGSKCLEEAVNLQCLPQGAKKNVAELSNIIKNHQSEVLFILDGYEVHRIYIFPLCLLLEIVWVGTN